jgi:hypothetical protein
MNLLLDNPFSLTKANDYSDAQINDYWVDIPDGNGFLGVLKPASPMPTLILGGKGSGKTHLMRYCSFEIQKLRHSDALLQSIKQEGYIGIYTRCEGVTTQGDCDPTGRKGLPSRAPRRCSSTGRPCLRRVEM